jgi:hypothetical protein
VVPRNAGRPRSWAGVDPVAKDGPFVATGPKGVTAFLTDGNPRPGVVGVSSALPTGARRCRSVIRLQQFGRHPTAP